MQKINADFHILYKFDIVLHRKHQFLDFFAVLGAVVLEFEHTTCLIIGISPIFYFYRHIPLPPHRLRQLIGAGRAVCAAGVAAAFSRNLFPIPAVHHLDKSLRFPLHPS
jgi:hypothetical protein